MEDVWIRNNAVEQSESLNEKRHRIHRYARAKNGHDREREGVNRTRLLVETHAEVLRYRTRLRAIIKRHHKDAHEDHSRNRPNPVEMAGDNSVLCARGTHPNDFLRTEISGDERQPTDPGRNRTSRKKKVIARAHVAFQSEPD